MSTEAVEVQEKKSEPLFSKKNRKLISNPLDIDNPITVQILGVCSALSSNHTDEAGFCDVVGVNHCNGIIKRRDFINAKFHTITDTDYCTAGCRISLGNSC